MNFSIFRRRMSAIFAAGILAGTVMFGAGQAQAAMVYEWTINNTSTFTDVGYLGTLEGTFLFDDYGDAIDATGEISAVSLSLSWAGGPPLRSTNTFSGIPNSSSGLAFEINSVDNTYLLIVSITSSFGEISGNIGDDFNFDFLVQLNRCDETGCLTVVDTGDIFGTSALVSAVPVPAALPLFGTGLAIMGFLGWRRKSKAAAA